MVTPGGWSLRLRNLNRTPGTFGEFTSAELVERYGTPDSLQVTGQLRDLAPFAVPGRGCTFADESGNRRFNGPLTQIVRRGNGTCTLTWASDLISLWERVVFPDPAHVITAQTADHDVRGGPAETVLLGYIGANAGPAAPVAPRRVAGLTVPTSAGRGSTIVMTARLDVLGRLVADIAESADLRVQVLQVGTDLAVTVTTVPDLSATARYGPAEAGGPGVLGEDWAYTLSRPTTTDVIVAAGGEGAARLFAERTDTAQEIAWGARVETMLDQRQTTDVDEITKAGDDELAAGSAPVEISATLLDSPDLRLGIDVPLGALISLDLAGELVVDRLRQLTTTIANSEGSASVQVVPLVGSLEAGLTRDQKQFLAVRRALRKVTTT